MTLTPFLPSFFQICIHFGLGFVPSISPKESSLGALSLAPPQRRDDGGGAIELLEVTSLLPADPNELRHTGGE